MAEHKKINADEMMKRMMSSGGIPDLKKLVEDQTLTMDDIAIIALKLANAAITALMSLDCISPAAMIELLNKTSKMIDDQIEFEEDSDDET